MNVKHIRKLLVAVAAALASLTLALVDEQVTSSEGVAVAVAFLAAYGVYRIPNEDK